jgi:hypothetical protein
MGLCKSICKGKEAPDLEEQYQSLMSSKPIPVTLATVRQFGFPGPAPMFDEYSPEFDLDNVNDGKH